QDLLRPGPRGGIRGRPIKQVETVSEHPSSTRPLLRGFGHMIPHLPTAEEINVFDSLDELDAVEHFLGKDLEQAQSLFRENFLRYQEDLMFMGPKAFQFYVP